MKKGRFLKTVAIGCYALICLLSFGGCQTVGNDPAVSSCISCENGLPSSAGETSKPAIAERDPEQQVCPPRFFEETSERNAEKTGKSASDNGSGKGTSSAKQTFSVDSLPPYSGEPFVVVGDNIPDFRYADLTRKSYEKYGPLDALGRCGVCIANVGKDLMPTEERTSIGSVKPTGWQTVKYDSIDGKYLYNRCHLIGFQLTGETTNERNLITGTRYLNVVGMLPFENMVADYVKETDYHVLYRVTPVFSGNNLLASGVHMEGYSVEDDGDGICFNVYCYNVQPGITIDYATGKSTSKEKKKESSSGQPSSQTSSMTAKQSSETVSSDKSAVSSEKERTDSEEDKTDDALVWIPTNGGKKYHSKSSCGSMIDPIQVPRSTAEKNGYEPCGRCY